MTTSDTAGEPPAEVKELRFALVCYGGVSLAIYMHGVTKELHKLVVASRAFEQDQKDNPFAQSDVERVYWKLFKHVEERQGVRLRVVIDIISGTSAGGIDGIVLAKALAGNLSQEPLRDVWIEKGDIKKMMVGPGFLPLWLKAAWYALLYFVPIWNPPPPLNGDRMFGWIHEALRGMARPQPDVLQLASLMPEGHDLELFVTLTDFYGHPRYIPIHDPSQVADLRHRHVLEFRYGGEGSNQLDESHNPALSFAARASSSFPGAFPPINIRNISENLGDGWPGQRDFESDFFRVYELSDNEAGDTFFVDGGVLDNFPFGHAIEAIAKKPAAVEVDRRLIYIQPDPGDPLEGPNGRKPGWRETIGAAMSGIPSHEPILDDLLKIRDFNERVARVNQIVAASRPRVRRMLESIASEGGYSTISSIADIERWRKAINERARDDAGISYAGYLQTKLDSVVAQLAGIVNGVCNFPNDSNHAAFTRNVMRIWALRRGIVGETVQPGEAQIRFLRTFDMAFRRRRLRFMVQALNGHYARVGEAGWPARTALDTAKKALYGLIHDLSAATDPEEIGGELSDHIRRTFDEDKLKTLIRGGLDEGTFEEEWGRRIDWIEDRLRDHLDPWLSEFRGGLYKTYFRVTRTWGEEARGELLLRYVGFPYWDILVYPIRAMSDVGELDEIEVVRMSPDDVSLLEPRGASNKLKGIGLRHFGAFYKRSFRENDYLWGRLDSVERLITTIGSESAAHLCKEAFSAVLADERGHLKKIRKTLDGLDHQIARLS